MTRPTARVLALLEILQGGGLLSARELGERLGVDERTVRRYAEHLTDLGIPIEARRGRFGGYRLMPGFKLPPLMLTDEEAVAVVLGLAAGQRVGLVTEAPEATASASAKIRRVLPPALAERLEALLAAADLTGRAGAASPPGTAVLLALADAADRRQPVLVTYTAWRGASSRRRLEPYGLVFHFGRWYVIGSDSQSGEIRTFRLDRINAVEPIAGSFEVPADFDPTARVLSGLVDVPYPHEVSVLLHAPLDTVRERLPVSVATLREVGNGVRMVLRANQLAWVARVLAWLDCPFTIEYPDTLRDEVRALAERLGAGGGG
ncbi:helix-turn-helix transcriptional regulator [Actinophytocola xanthii]|uniref:Transcriptional regulator n=1 Tax=Actinophytocola xanthii TaxID=1912961 RepID=A0A1Q8CMB7_9PSEU|nr:YafY family protein [Actinophytocola xanthii]OLF15492.1 transcriptional regulator [Actinophytocola xanthii]